MSFRLHRPCILDKLGNQLDNPNVSATAQFFSSRADGPSGIAPGNPYVAPYPDLHVDLNVTQQQIDAVEVVDLDVPDVGIVEIKLPQLAQDGFMLRLSEILPDKGTVIAHIKVE